jgi:uncharacterized protein (DUF4415 family)
MSKEFEGGKRGPIISPDPQKVRITIRLDGDIIEFFKARVHQAGGGNYQTLINEALREYMKSDDKLFEKRLRKIIREELKKAS